MNEKPLLCYTQLAILPTRFLTGLALLFLGLTLVACNSNNVATPEKPTGDPTESARDFIIALYTGDATACRELSSSQIRLSILEICTRSANANAGIDLSETIFEVTSRQAANRATVRMRGRWIISADTPQGRATEVHDTATEQPLLIGMLFEDGKWRVDGIEEQLAPYNPTAESTPQ
jgi:hypothetical protein